jgi:RNA 2',3'-cyclic 3'-phosphodiesterase
MDELIRTFIAVQFPDNIRDAILKLQDRLKAGVKGVKWVAPENIHLTLRFLGDLCPDDIFHVSEAVSASVKDMPVFGVSAKGIGAFPSLSRPRVLWIGLGGDVKSLRELALRISENLEVMGIEKEKRDFTGHLTIGRVKEKVNPAQLVKFIKDVRDIETEFFHVDRVSIFKSQLTPSGSIYSRIYDAFLTPITI